MKSAWKIPHFNIKLLFWTPPVNPDRRRIPLKRKQKTITVYQPMVWRIFEFYTGKKTFTRGIQESIVGLPLGQLIRTKKHVKHNAKKIKKQKAKKAKELRKKMPKTQSREHQLRIEAMRRKRKKRK